MLSLYMILFTAVFKHFGSAFSQVQPIRAGGSLIPESCMEYENLQLFQNQENNIGRIIDLIIIFSDDASFSGNDDVLKKNSLPFSQKELKAVWPENRH